MRPKRVFQPREREERIVRQLVMPPQHLMVRERHDGVPKRLILTLDLLRCEISIRDRRVRVQTGLVEVGGRGEECQTVVAHVLVSVMGKHDVGGFVIMNMKLSFGL